MTTGGKHSNKAFEVKKRQQQAVNLRLAGATYQEIADSLGVTPPAVHKYMKKEMDQLRKETEQDAEHLRAMEISKLDAAQKAIWSQVTKGHLGAVDRLVRISDRRAKLLGLDAPAKTQLSPGAGTDGEGGVVLYIPDNGRPHPGRDDASET